MITFHGGRVERTWLPGPRGRRMWRVWDDIEVRIFGLHLCWIEAGFLTDHTSWPALLDGLRWFPKVRSWLGDPRDRYSPAARLHDRLLQSDWPKWVVDLLYKMALRSCGVSALEAWLFGSAVRLKRGR